MDFPQFLDSVEQRMHGTKFKVSRDVTLPDGNTVGLAARRNTFLWKGLVVLSQHILVTHKTAPTVADFQSLFRSGFEHAKKVNRIPLLRGMQFGYVVIPCIAGPSMDRDVVNHVTGQPEKHWSLYEFPVAVDLGSGETHYFRGRSMWGALFFSNLRALASDYLEGDKRDLR